MTALWLMAAVGCDSDVTDVGSGPGVTNVGSALAAGELNRRTSEAVLEVVGGGLATVAGEMRAASRDSNVNPDVACIVYDDASTGTVAFDVNGCPGRTGNGEVTVRHGAPVTVTFTADMLGRAETWLSGSATLAAATDATGYRLDITQAIWWFPAGFTEPIGLSGSWRIGVDDQAADGTAVTLAAAVTLAVADHAYRLTLVDVQYRASDELCETIVNTGTIVIDLDAQNVTVRVDNCNQAETTGRGPHFDVTTGKWLLDFSRNLASAATDLGDALTALLEEL